MCWRYQTRISLLGKKYRLKARKSRLIVELVELFREEEKLFTLSLAPAFVVYEVFARMEGLGRT